MPDSPLSPELLDLASGWVRRLLDDVRKEDAPPQRSDLRQSCLEACSVLAVFPSGPIRVRGRVLSPAEVERALGEDRVAVPVVESATAWWTLTPQSRAEGLDSLGSLERMWETRRWNESPDTYLIQQVFDEYLQRNYSAADSLDPARLEAALHVTEWLARFDSSMPPAGVVDMRLSRRRLLARMERLTAGFMGRTDDLKELRSFVGILEPQTPFERASRFLQELVSSEAKPPLLIHGIGGLGKSTLLAEFIRQHANSATPFPYVYLDFDNPRLNVRNLGTLVREMADQLEAQYPGSEWATVRKTAAEVSLETEASDTDSASEQHTIVFTAVAGNINLRASGAARVAADFASCLTRAMESSAMERMMRLASYLPFLLVLDTFEEVQKRGIEMASILWQFLGELQRAFPRTRIVVSGRAPVPEMVVNGKPAREYPLKPFDEPAAIALLSAAGIGDPKLARTLFKQVGGNPLSLKLVAQVAKRGDIGEGGVENLKTTSYWLFSAAETVVQGQLYRRILGRIQDPSLRQLAHPGLVARRLTAEIIEKVLAVPCGLGEISPERAEELFAELQKQVDLVIKEPDGALRHQQEIRRVMLRLLEEERPEQVRQIHEAAYRYYQPLMDSASRVEKIYHALQLGRPEDEIRSIWWDEAAENLLSAADEFPPSSRLLLYLLAGRSPDPELRRLADQEQWEQIVETKCRQEIRYGDYQSARRLLNERRERMPGSALYALEATVCMWQNEPGEAMKLIDGGIESAQAVNRLDRLAELWRLRGDIQFQGGRKREGDASMQKAQQLARRIHSPVLALQIFAQRVRAEVKPPVQELDEILASVSDTEFASIRLQVRGLFRSCGAESDGLLRKGLRSLKLPHAGYWLLEHRALGELARRMQSQDRVNEILEKLLDWMASRDGVILSRDEMPAFDWVRSAGSDEHLFIRRAISDDLELALNPNVAQRSA